MSDSSCLTALLNLYPYLDGELKEDEATEVRRHFELCTPCTPALNYLRSFRNALYRAAAGQGGAPTHVQQRVRQLLDSASA